MKGTFLFSISFLMSLIIASCDDQGDPIAPSVIIPTPTLSSVAPDSGTVGDVIKIVGTNFGSVQGSSTVQFGIVSAIVITGWSAIEINVKIPTGATSDSISVTVSGKTSNKKYFKVVVPPAAPNISTIVPDSGKVGDTITVNGTNFGTTQGSSSVSFGATNVTSVILWSGNQIKIVVPSGLSVGTTTLAMTVNGVSSNAKSFKVLGTVAATVSFASDVLPLFTTTYGCTGCHGGQNNLFLGSHSQVIAGNSDHGPVIIAGNASGSILVKKLRTATLPFGSRMPFGSSQVSDTDLQKIVDWINQGALNN